MNREIKFRGKRINNGQWVYGYLYQSESKSWLTDSRNIDLGTHRNFAWYEVIPESVGQSFGLTDKNDAEIYEGQHLRIKGIMGNSGEYSFDAIYKVGDFSYDGIELSFVKLFNQEPDSMENSYPIATIFSFYYNSLDTDYMNGRGNAIAVKDTHGSNPMLGTTWRQHHYTNDIEIIEP